MEEGDYRRGNMSQDRRVVIRFFPPINLNVYQVQQRIANRTENMYFGEEWKEEEWERVRDQSESLSVLCQLPSVCQSTSQKL